MDNPHIGSTLDTAHLAATGEVRALPYGRCPSCGGDVDLCKGTGRTRAVAHDVVLAIPDDLLLPTCVRCGERPSIPEVTAVLDALLEAIAERDEANEQNAANARECGGLLARLQAVEAERDEARALKVPPTCDELDMAHMDAAVARIERDIAYKTISRLNRRAQEAERMALHAMRVGLDAAEGLRSLVHYWRREAQARRRELDARHEARVEQRAHERGVW